MEVLGHVVALKMETQICRPEASLGHTFQAWAADSPLSCLRLSGHGEHRQGQKCVGGGGQRHQCPLIQPTCYCSHTWERSNRALHTPLPIGTLSVWALSLTS